jgi:hypothetical protein
MDEQTYREQALQFLEKEDRFACNAFPCLGDDKGHGFDEHYVYHVAWAVRKINEVNPKIHYDISSSLYLCTTLAATIPTKFFDYRKPNLQVPNLLVGRIDISVENLDPVESLSCCHVVEHIGLGRYGDQLDNTGDLKAIQNLKKSAGKHLFFVVPVGIPCVEFNAHRIYSPVYIASLFPEFKCQEFYLIPNNGEKPSVSLIQELDLPYACGCFHFIRENT